MLLQNLIGRAILNEVIQVPVLFNYSSISVKNYFCRQCHIFPFKSSIITRSATASDSRVYSLIKLDTQQSRNVERRYDHG